MNERVITSEFMEEDIVNEYSLRPLKLSEYIGQEKVKDNLKVFIKAAQLREESLDHVILHGPPGLGKTTLANIIAREMGGTLKITSGPAIEKAGDLASILTTLTDKDVLFIDEIHRLSRTVEEILYPAMEDYALDIVIGKGPSARSIRLKLPRFTVIGATTGAASTVPNASSNGTRSGGSGTTRCMMRALASSLVSTAARASSVAMVPGATALTRMPRSTSASAMARVSWLIAPLLAL